MNQALVNGSSQLPEDGAWAYQALLAALLGEWVWVAESLDASGIKCFGLRYVSEEDLDFTINLDDYIQDASGVIDSSLEPQSDDPSVLAAVTDEWLSQQLIIQNETAILYDSFAEEADFRSAVACALEDWESSQQSS